MSKFTGKITTKMKKKKKKPTFKANNNVQIKMNKKHKTNW